MKSKEDVIEKRINDLYILNSHYYLYYGNKKQSNFQ